MPVSCAIAVGHTGHRSDGKIARSGARRAWMSGMHHSRWSCFRPRPGRRVRRRAPRGAVQRARPPARRCRRVAC